MVPKISIIIPNKNNIDYLKRCIHSMDKLTYKNYEVIIIDNGSTDEKVFSYYGELVQDEKYKIIVHKIEFNYSYMNNAAVKYAEGEYLLLLNNDTEFIFPSTLEVMLNEAKKNDVGAVGSLLLFEDKTIQHMGVSLVNLHPFHMLSSNELSIVDDFDEITECLAVTGACLMVHIEKYKQVSGLNKDLKVVYNDVDFCLKLYDVGYKNVCVNSIYLFHHESVSRKDNKYPEDIALFFDIWEKYLLENQSKDTFGHRVYKNMESVLLDRDFYIFGTGERGKSVFSNLQQFNSKFNGFIDNDVFKQGQLLFDYKIRSFEEVLPIYGERTLIIIASHFGREIKTQLEQAGIPKYNIICI